MPNQGKVYLVGAGPGDEKLLSLRAAELLEKADAVVYDQLVSPEILERIPEGVQRVFVGKAGSQHTWEQEEISSLLVRLAESGKCVIRLKGGDPFVFGRGGEEAEVLAEAGVEFEVVPGITAAVAAAAVLGIPLTHRDFASQVTFVTGQEDPTKTESAVNWRAIVQGKATLVFYMGVKQLSWIAKRLQDEGMPAGTPAAVVRYATWPQEESFQSTLGKVAQEAEKRGLKPPALFIVGEVVRLRSQLAWREKKALFGRHIVVTRARRQANTLCEELRNEGACVTECPTIRISAVSDWQEVDQAIRSLCEYDLVVFTSANGVASFWDRLQTLGKDARALGRAQLAAIGPSTAAALKDRGLLADFVPDEFVAEDLARELVEKASLKGKRVLLVRGNRARPVLKEQLERTRASVEEITVYVTEYNDQAASLLKQALDQPIDYVTFTSSSAVDGFTQIAGIENVKKLADQIRWASIGPVTSAALRRYGLEPALEASVYTIEGLVQAIVEDAKRVYEKQMV